MTALRRAQWYGYGLGFEPVTYFDGGDAAFQETLYDALRSRVDAARSRKTMLEMALDTAATGIVGSELRVGVRITTLDTLVDDIDGLMLVAVVFQDSVTRVRFGSTDTSYVPIAADIIGGPWGVPVRLRYATELDTVLATPYRGWRQDRLGVAVFVQDTATRAVMQTVVTRKLARE
ncbi:MAG: hypothetical protein R6X12_01470 [bacterium]